MFEVFWAIGNSRSQKIGCVEKLKKNNLIYYYIILFNICQHYYPLILLFYLILAIFKCLIEKITIQTYTYTYVASRQISAMAL